MSSVHHSASGSPTPSQFRCSHPGCKRSFKRKEHLSRHVKSHDASLKHRCHICGSTFARSDVLRRHVQHHPQINRVGRTHIACTPCHERKTKCDNDTPCTPCLRGSITCYRREEGAPVVQPENQSAEALPSDGNSVSLQDTVDPQSTDHEHSDSRDVAEAGPADQGEQNSSRIHQMTARGNVSAEMTHLVAVYFVDVHAIWPILHQATFEQSNVTRELLMAVGTLGSYWDGSEHHTKLAPVLYAAILGTLIQPEIYFQDLQAGLLTLVYYLHFASSKRMLEKASHLNAALISTYRSRNVFSGICEGQHDPSEPFRDWVHQEEVKRLALFAMRADTYLSMISDQPPTIRYSELEHSLPKSESLWSASSYEEQQRLEWSEPAAREKILFANLVFDAANAGSNLGQRYRLSADDHHMLLCALQSDVWDVTRQRGLAKSPKIAGQSGWTPQVAILNNQLDQWARGVEEYSQLRQHYFSGNSEETTLMVSSVSLYMWHLMAIRIHYPVNDQAIWEGDLSMAGDGYVRQRSANDIRLQQESTNSRMALWHAVQITRIHVHESSLIPSSTMGPRSRFNHFHSIALGRAAVVVCKYARYVPSCSTCAGRYCDTMDLVIADRDHDVFQQWREGGSLHPYVRFGPLELSLCSCNFNAIATWYQELLKKYEFPADIFATFLQVLQST